MIKLILFNTLKDLAREIIMTLGEAFEVAYQMALKDKAMVEASEFEQKLSQSDTDESSISSSKASINTVWQRHLPGDL